MGKNLLLFVFFVMLFLCVHAQEKVNPEKKSTVLVDRFTCADGVDPKLIDALRGSVLEAFNGRVVLIDALKGKYAQSLELKRRANGELILNDEGNLEQLKSISTIGAEYMVSGKVMRLSTERKEKIVKVDVKDADGKPVKNPEKTYENLKKDSVVVSYDCSIDYFLELTKISDGSLVKSASYTDVKNAATEADAKKNAIFNLGYNSALRLVRLEFPLRGTILEVSEEKKGRATEVYINIGSDHGISVGLSLSVYLHRVDKIGDITVVAVEGKDISRCYVPKKKCGEAILSAMRNAETLEVLSIF